MDDDGDIYGWPREGLCLLVSQGRSRPAWKVKDQQKVLVYGESRAQARSLNKAKGENLEPIALNNVQLLAQRFQEEWKSASSSQRESLILGLDEMEARRMAPPAFIHMINELRRAALALGTQESLGPCGSIGREFYPNLFAPLAGDPIRVLYDAKTWYEGVVLERDDARRHGTASSANYFAEPGVDLLQIRFLDDGQRDSIPWPEPEDEAFLLAQPPSVVGGYSRRRRRATIGSISGLCIPRDWRPFLTKINGNFEAACTHDVQRYLQIEPANAIDRRRPSTIAAQSLLYPTETNIPQEVKNTPSAVQEEDDTVRHEAHTAAFIDATKWFYALTKPKDKTERNISVAHTSTERDNKETECSLTIRKAARCCLALRLLARPLSALLEDFGTLRNRNTQTVSGSAVTALAQLADALSVVVPTNALPKEYSFHDNAKEQVKQIFPTNVQAPEWLVRAEMRPAAKAHLALEFYLDPDLEIPAMNEQEVAPVHEEKSVVTDEDKIEHLRATAAHVAIVWDEKRKHQPIGVEAFYGAPCFALLNKSQVSEPHKAWLTRASEIARSVLLKQDKDSTEDSSSSSDDEGEKKNNNNISPTSSSDSSNAEGKSKKRKKKQVVPRRYRPPGAAARKIMCGGDELAMEVLAPEICISLAGGLGADMSEKIQVVRLECGPMRGERGVVARAEIEARSVLPYAGLIVADDELASLLWQEPRAVAHCLMYRYEFAGPQISVLPYLQSPSCAPAPFVNCARGPHSTEAIVWQTSRTLDKSNEEISLKLSWRSWGSEHIGARIRRTVDGGGFADGTVVAWLDANESDFVVNDIPAALWRVKYDDNSVLAGDFQDLELHEILSSAKAPLPVETTTLDLPSIPNRACSEESVVSTNANKQANCHFEEVTADGAVLGVYVVASRKIMRGEPLLVTYGCEFWSGWIQRRSRLEELERAADTLCNSCYELIKAIDSERDGQADDDQRITTTNDHHPFSSSSSISCCDENNNMMIDENTTNEQASKRHQVPTRIDRHEVWRYLIGVPFQAQRTIRGERGCLAVVVGLAVEPPAECSLTEFQINDRVEGYWRGSAPSFAATVAGFDQEGNAYLDYDDGFKEVTDLVLPLRSQREWIQMETVQVGTWVRHFEHITANGRSRREGIVVSKMFAQDGGLLLNVMTDDGFLETEQPARDWEPLLVVRFATNNEQRVMNIDQLLFMQPLFINAQTEEPLFADASSANKQLFSFLDHGEHVHQHLVQYFFHSNDPREDHKENTQQNNDEKIPPCLKVDIARVLTEVGLPRMPKLARGCA